MTSDDKENEVRQIVRERVIEDLPMIFGAIFEGIYELDESSRALVLKKVGATCAQAVQAQREKAGMEYPTGVDMDTACEFYVRAALSNEKLKRDFTCERDGDIVEIRDAIGELLGGCSCRLVLAGFLEPHESLCRLCQEGFWEYNFKHMTGEQLEKMEAPESTIMGHRDCVARCHFKPAR